jgi:hypothetical protein
VRPLAAKGGKPDPVALAAAAALRAEQRLAAARDSRAVRGCAADGGAGQLASQAAAGADTQSIQCPPS